SAIATLKIYTPSLRDALPICCTRKHHRRYSGKDIFLRHEIASCRLCDRGRAEARVKFPHANWVPQWWDCKDHLPSTVRVLHRRRSEEHTSELQSHEKHVCRLM